MSSKLMTDIINQSNGGINASFFIDSNLTEIMTILEDNEDILETMEWVGKAFECYQTDRFVGTESEKDLEDLAIKLNQNGEFLAGK